MDRKESRNKMKEKTSSREPWGGMGAASKLLYIPSCRPSADRARGLGEERAEGRAVQPEDPTRGHHSV